MKFTKFIPAVCALAFASTAAFADPVTLNANYEIEVPVVFSITQTALNNTSGTVTIATNPETGDVTGLSWPNAMGATYHVVSNAPTKTFYIKATCPVAGNPKAFASTVTGETASAVGTTLLAFANIDATTDIPTSTQIDNAVSGDPVAASNANVIAVQFTRGIVAQTVGSCSSIPMTSRELVYTITSGQYDVPYTLGTSAVAGTFSTHDQAGTYQAVVTITDAPSA